MVKKLAVPVELVGTLGLMARVQTLKLVEESNS